MTESFFVLLFFLELTLFRNNSS